MVEGGESGISAVIWIKKGREDQLGTTSLTILVAYLACNEAGVTSRPVRFLPLMDSSYSFLYSF